jgi:alpha-glucosidase
MRVRPVALAAMFLSYMMAPAAWSQTVVATASSPGGILTVDVQLDNMGKLAYDIKRNRRTSASTSPTRPRWTTASR